MAKSGRDVKRRFSKIEKRSTGGGGVFASVLCRGERCKARSLRQFKLVRKGDRGRDGEF
jgi:hypothetical protein